MPSRHSVSLRHRAERGGSNLARIAAFFLALTLALPNSSLALRTEQRQETDPDKITTELKPSPARLAQLAPYLPTPKPPVAPTLLTPAAGAEEEAPAQITERIRVMADVTYDVAEALLKAVKASRRPISEIIAKRPVEELIAPLFDEDKHLRGSLRKSGLTVADVAGSVERLIQAPGGETLIFLASPLFEVLDLRRIEGLSLATPAVLEHLRSSMAGRISFGRRQYRGKPLGSPDSAPAQMLVEWAKQSVGLPSAGAEEWPGAVPPDRLVKTLEALQRIIGRHRNSSQREFSQALQFWLKGARRIGISDQHWYRILAGWDETPTDLLRLLSHARYSKKFEEYVGLLWVLADRIQRTWEEEKSANFWVVRSGISSGTSGSLLEELAFQFLSDPSEGSLPDTDGILLELLKALGVPMTVGERDPNSPAAGDPQSSSRPELKLYPRTDAGAGPSAGMEEGSDEAEAAVTFEMHLSPAHLLRDAIVHLEKVSGDRLRLELGKRGGGFFNRVVWPTDITELGLGRGDTVVVRARGSLSKPALDRAARMIAELVPQIGTIEGLVDEEDWLNATRQMQQAFDTLAEGFTRGLPPAAGAEETADEMAVRLGQSSAAPVTREEVEKIRFRILQEAGEARWESLENPSYVRGESSPERLADLLLWMNALPEARLSGMPVKHPESFDLLMFPFERGKLDAGDPVAHAALVAWAMGTFPIFSGGNHRTGWALMNVALMRSGVLRQPLVWQESRAPRYYEILGRLDLAEFVALIRSYIEADVGTESGAGLEEGEVRANVPFPEGLEPDAREAIHRRILDVTRDRGPGLILSVQVVPELRNRLRGFKTRTLLLSETELLEDIENHIQSGQARTPEQQEALLRYVENAGVIRVPAAGMEERLLTVAQAMKVIPRLVARWKGKEHFITFIIPQEGGGSDIVTTSVGALRGEGQELRKMLERIASGPDRRIRLRRKWDGNHVVYPATGGRLWTWFGWKDKRAGESFRKFTLFDRVGTFRLIPREGFVVPWGGLFDPWWMTGSVFTIFNPSSNGRWYLELSEPTEPSQGWNERHLALRKEGVSWKRTRSWWIGPPGRKGDPRMVRLLEKRGVRVEVDPLEIGILIRPVGDSPIYLADFTEPISAEPLGSGMEEVLREGTAEELIPWIGDQIPVWQKMGVAAIDVVYPEPLPQEMSDDREPYRLQSVPVRIQLRGLLDQVVKTVGRRVSGELDLFEDPERPSPRYAVVLVRDDPRGARILIRPLSAGAEERLTLAEKPVPRTEGTGSEGTPPPAAGAEEDAPLAKFQKELARPDVTGGQGIRGRTLTGAGHTYDALVLDHFPSGLVPALAGGLSPLLASLDSEGDFTWVDAAGGLGAALKEGSLRLKNLSPLLVDAVRWTPGQFHPDTLARLGASAQAAGVALWSDEIPLIQESAQTVDLRSRAKAPVRLITMMNALAYNPDPFRILENLFNQLEPGGLLLANLYIPTDHAKAEDLARFYARLGDHLREQGVEADFKITDWSKEDRLTAEQERAPFPEYSVGMVLKKGPSQQLKVVSQPQSEPFAVQTVRIVTYQVAWYGDDPTRVIQVVPAARPSAPPGAGLEEGARDLSAEEVIRRVFERAPDAVWVYERGEKGDEQIVAILTQTSPWLFIDDRLKRLIADLWPQRDGEPPVLYDLVADASPVVDGGSRLKVIAHPAAGMEERLTLDETIRRVHEGVRSEEFLLLELYQYDASGRLVELSAESRDSLKAAFQFQADGDPPRLRQELQALLEQSDDRKTLVLIRDPPGKAFYLMPARSRPEEERLRDEARILLRGIASDLAIAWDAETLDGTSAWDFPASTALLQPYGGVFGISREEFYALLKKERPFPILRPAADFVPLDRLIWWVEGSQDPLTGAEKKKNRPFRETQRQAELLWLAALHLLDHLAAEGPDAPISEALLRRWMESSQRKVALSEQQIRAFSDRTRVLFAEVVESLRQRPSPAAGAEEGDRAGGVAQAVREFRVEQKGAVKLDAGFYLEGEGALGFAPALALLEAREVLNIESFAGIVETAEEKRRLLAVVQGDPEAAALMEERIYPVEKQTGPDRQARYETARAFAEAHLRGFITLVRVRTRESDLLAQLDRLLSFFGYRLPEDPAVQKAARTLLQAA